MSDKCKIAAGIVTYNPDILLITQQIKSLMAMKIPIVIVDNCSKNREAIVSTANEHQCSFLGNSENLGIAAALNQILEFNCRNGFEWVLTFDQDSDIPVNLRESFCASCRPEVGVVSPKIEYIGNLQSHSEAMPRAIDEIEWAISSASMVNVDAWRSVGGFDEAMFIDLVDKDFCIRVKRAGYSILRDNNVCLKHRLGDSEERRFIFKKITVGNHSPIRKYYKSRNYVYLAKKGVVSRSHAVSQVLILCSEVILYEGDKAEKIKAIASGLFAGSKMSR